MEYQEYDCKVEDVKLKAAGWKEDYIGLWSKPESEFALDTNAVIGTIYHKSYMGFDGSLSFFYTAAEALTWMDANEEKYKGYGDKE